MILSGTMVIVLALIGTSLANPMDLKPRGNKITLGYRTASKVSYFKLLISYHSSSLSRDS